MKPITPCLWFDRNGEEAAKFYCSVFKDSKLGAIAHYGKAASQGSGQPEKSVMTVEFSACGQDFLALNGGPHFKFNPSVSLFVHCTDEAQVDEVYGQLSQGGKVLMPLTSYPFSKKYAWVADRFGVTWQINLTGLPQQKITTALLFVGKALGRAEEAVKFYVSIFKEAKITTLVHKGDGRGVQFAGFSLNGQEFTAMDGNERHGFNFNEALSLVINCDTQQEIDFFWDKLIADGGSPSQCGWLRDKFGLSWQVTPANMAGLARSDDERADRTMAALMDMQKLDIATLQAAYDGR